MPTSFMWLSAASSISGWLATFGDACKTRWIAVWKFIFPAAPGAVACGGRDLFMRTFFGTFAKFGGMEASDVHRLRDLEAEHNKLKRMYADLAMENHGLKDLVAKKL